MPKLFTIAKSLVKDRFDLALGSSLFAGLGAYLGKDILVNDWFPSLGAPDGLHNVPIPTKKTIPQPIKRLPTPLSPDVTTSLKPIADELNSNNSAVYLKTQAMIATFEADALALSQKNKTLIDTYESSPLLQNQMIMKDTLDTIPQAIQEQSAIFASLYEMFDSHLTMINNTMMLMAHHGQRSADHQGNQALSQDNGNNDSIIPFENPSEFYSKVDQAYKDQQSRANLPIDDYFLPSRQGIDGELSLIADMQFHGRSNSEIRDKVEDYRKGVVGAELSALLLNPIYSSAVSNAQMARSATKYYDGASEAIKTKVGSALAEHGTTVQEASANAMLKVATALAPVAEWADHAKVREVYLQTPSVVTDMDGNVLATASPMELTTTKDASIAREKTDINTEEFDESMFPSLSLPILPFVGSSDIYNPVHATPTINPFTHKEL